MTGRDDRAALEAKAGRLERELAATRAQLRRPSRLADAGRSFADGSGRATAATPSGWTPTRAWLFAGFAALVLGALLAAFLFGEALDRTGMFEVERVLSDHLWVAITGFFLGPPLLVMTAALLLRAPGNVLATGGVTLATVVCTSLLIGAITPLREAPLVLLGTTIKGSIEAVTADRRVTWAEIQPAHVWTAKIGTGVSSQTDEDGRIHTSSDSAAPIVPAIPWSGEISLFACDDAEDLRTDWPDDGTIAGRVIPVADLAADAVRDLAQREGLRVGPHPRCIRPTLGDAGTTYALSLAIVACFLLVAPLGGAWLLLHTASARST
jgi:hypothetical protein